MAFIDADGNVFVSNSFPDLVSRMFSNSYGLLLVLVPLLILIVVYFKIKKSQKYKQKLNIYMITALILYLLYFFLISQLFVAF